MFLNFTLTGLWGAFITMVVGSTIFAVYQGNRYDNSDNKNYVIVSADVSDWIDSLKKADEARKEQAKPTFTPEVFRDMEILKHAAKINAKKDGQSKSFVLVERKPATQASTSKKKDTLIEPDKIVPPPPRIEVERVKPRWRKTGDTSWHYPQ